MEPSKRSTFKLLFYLKKNAPKKNGKVAIMGRITLDGKISQFSTKLEINPNQWDLKFGRLLGKSEDARIINQNLDKIRSTINQHYSEMMHLEGFATSEKLKNTFLGIGVMENSLLRAYHEHNQEYKKLVQNNTIVSGTYAKYITVYNALKEFLRDKMFRTDIAFIELTPDFISEFDTYLRAVRACDHNTVWNYMMPLRRIVRQSVKKGLIRKDPFDDYKIKLKEKNRGFLMREEVEKIIRYQPCSDITNIEVVKDIFIFSCFTGLSYIDIKNLKASNIQTFFDGHTWIIKRRKKTNVISNVRLLDIPLKIIEKYQGLARNEFIFPVPCNTTCNVHFRYIAKQVGIIREKPLTFHMARHSFATMFLTEGVPLESISSMLGHKDISTTQIYAKITSQKISRDMDLLSKKFSEVEAVYN